MEKKPRKQQNPFKIQIPPAKPIPASSDESLLGKRVHQDLMTVNLSKRQNKKKEKFIESEDQLDSDNKDYSLNDIPLLPGIKDTVKLNMKTKIFTAGFILSYQMIQGNVNMEQVQSSLEEIEILKSIQSLYGFKKKIDNGTPLEKSELKERPKKKVTPIFVEHVREQILQHRVHMSSTQMVEDSELNTAKIARSSFDRLINEELKFRSKANQLRYQRKKQNCKNRLVSQIINQQMSL